MADRLERLEKLNEKLARLRELKKKIEQRIKKERALAIRYAKEIAFWFLEATGEPEAEQKGKVYDITLKYLESSLCKRAKHKRRCLEKKLKLVLEYKSEFKKAHLVAKRLLYHMESSEKKETES